MRRQKEVVCRLDGGCLRWFDSHKNRIDILQRFRVIGFQNPALLAEVVFKEDAFSWSSTFTLVSLIFIALLA